MNADRNILIMSITLLIMAVITCFTVVTIMKIKQDTINKALDYAETHDDVELVIK